MELWAEYFTKLEKGTAPTKPKDFKAYRRATVRKRLVDLFHRKCAYCEHRVLAIAHGDIEHWRPKKAIQLSDGTKRDRGYWWRAADWENLLLSCTLCNQPPGKGIKFPVADEGLRATGPDDEAGEEPLLLDPTTDHPENHLEIATDGERRGLVVPLHDGGSEDRKARSSIDVFRLNRPDLVVERREALSQAVSLVLDVRLALRTIEALPPGSLRSDQLATLRSKLKDLHDKVTPASEFLALTRPIVEPFLVEIGAK